MQIVYYFVCVTLLIACGHNKIETDASLTADDKTYIRSLGLLDGDEMILKFYSEHTRKVAGNFFTEKRIAKYWIDERYEERNLVSFSFYPDIASIDTVYNAGFTYCPYLLVRKKDSTQFKVSVEGEPAEVQEFFEDALRLWKSNAK